MTGQLPTDSSDTQLSRRLLPTEHEVARETGSQPGRNEIHTGTRKSCRMPNATREPWHQCWLRPPELSFHALGAEMLVWHRSTGCRASLFTLPCRLEAQVVLSSVPILTARRARQQLLWLQRRRCRELGPQVSLRG